MYNHVYYYYYVYYLLIFFFKQEFAIPVWEMPIDMYEYVRLLRDLPLNQ